MYFYIIYRQLPFTLSMKRRDALNRVALLMGGALSAPTLSALLNGCQTATDSTKGVKFTLSDSQRNLISEIAEIIIPKTETPGAKDAKVGQFIELMLKDCYKSEDQKRFAEGLSQLEETKFLEGSAAEQTRILTELEKKAKDEMAKITEDRKKAKDAGKEFTEPGVPFFRLMKELTLLGYFTSKEGATLALEYVPIPGRYDGCIDLKPNQKAWAM